MSPASTAEAPTGGHTDRSAADSGCAALKTPWACSTQTESAAAPREYTQTVREPDSPAASTTPCTRAAPPGGSTNGANNVSSSTTEQPTSSPARNTNSTNPAPGNSITPSTT